VCRVGVGLPIGPRASAPCGTHLGRAHPISRRCYVRSRAGIFTRRGAVHVDVKVFLHENRVPSIQTGNSIALAYFLFAVVVYTALVTPGWLWAMLIALSRPRAAAEDQAVSDGVASDAEVSGGARSLSAPTREVRPVVERPADLGQCGELEGQALQQTAGKSRQVFRGSYGLPDCMQIPGKTCSRCGGRGFFSKKTWRTGNGGMCWCCKGLRHH